MKSLISAALSLSACAVFLVFWISSYFAYGLIAYEAYSGIGTELASVQGLIVFYHFDSYQGNPPPQDFSYSFAKPASRQGQRLQADFNFWEVPHWWCHLGFFFRSSDKAFTGHTKVLLISIPYWMPLSVLSPVSYLLYRRCRRPKSSVNNAKAIPPNAA